MPENDQTLQNNVRLQALVSGYVQGVGFRAFVQATAAGMDLTGWVRNTWEGDVEVVAEGPQPKLVRLLGLLRSGPRAARVVQVTETWQAATGEFHYFNVR